MEKIPFTTHSFEADRYIIVNNNARMLFQSIFNILARKISRDINELNHELKLSTDYLSKISGLHPQTVKTLRKVLCDMGLISASRGIVKVQLQHYLSLVSLLTDIFDDENKRTRFSNAVSEQDSDALKELGYRILDESEMKKMMAVLLFRRYKIYTEESDLSDDNMRENPVRYKICTEVGNKPAHISTNFVPKTFARYKIYTEGPATTCFGTKFIPNDGLRYKNYTEGVSSVQNLYRTTENDDASVQNLYRGGQQTCPHKYKICTEQLHELILKIGGMIQNDYQTEFLSALNLPEDAFGPIERYKFCTEEENLVNLGLWGLQALLTDYLRTVQNLYQSDFFGTKFVPNDPSSVVVFTHRTYKGEKQKKNSGSAAPLKEGLREENNFENFGKVEILSFGDEIHPELTEEELEEDRLMESSKNILKGLDIFQKDKINITFSPYRSKPYYTPQGIDEILNLEEAVKSPVKYILNNFFYELLGSWEEGSVLKDDFYSTEEENIPDPTIDDMIRYRPMFTIKEMGKAWERALIVVQGDIETGFIEDEHGRYKLEFDQLPEIEPMYIADWELNGDCVVFNVDKLRNIEAEDIAQIPAPKGKEAIRESRKHSREAMKSIMETEDSRLTPIERLIKRFSALYVRFDEFYSVVGFKDTEDDATQWRTLSARLYKAPLYFMAEECGISKTIFFQALNQDPDFKPDADIKSKPILFPYEKIANTNSQYGWKSSVILPVNQRFDAI